MIVSLHRQLVGLERQGGKGHTRISSEDSMVGEAINRSENLQES